MTTIRTRLVPPLDVESGRVPTTNGRDRVPQIEIPIGDHADFIVLPHSYAGLLAELLTFRWRQTKNSKAVLCHRVAIVDRHYAPRVTDELRRIADVGRDNRNAAGERFADRVGECFAGRCTHGDVERGLNLGDVATFAQQVEM